MTKIRKQFAVLLFVLGLSCFATVCQLPAATGTVVAQAAITELPTYSDAAYVEVNGNQPEFTEKQKKNTKAFETYSSLDSLGRCGVAFANICTELMPTEERESITSVHPSGWNSGMGWERCHLIAFTLAGENANEKNLITGTNYFNETGMLPFENLVANYVRETDNHVLYRVTPYFEGDNLVASGVQMEAWSVEDGGEGICFNVYVFNVQPGSEIDYETGIVNGAKKVAQYIEDGTYSKSFKASTVKKKSQSFSIGCTAKGKVTYKKLSGSGKLSVSKKGKVTVAKGTPAGTYKAKVKITAAASGNYKAKSITKTIVVRVTSKYILNTNTKVFHYPSCESVQKMNKKNKKTFSGTREKAIAKGYSSCKSCNP
jgi:DNA-entry nuclease